MGAAQTPTRVREVGIAHPRVLDIARILMSHGWRVTSIYRPGAPSHSKGLALDATPLIYHAGGFGFKTAALVYDLLCSYGFSDVTVVAEDDHLHIELATRFTPGPGVLTAKGLCMHNTYDRYLPEHPIGDVEDGDMYESGTVEVFNPETGDVDVYETGAPKRRKARRQQRRKKMKKAFGAIATGGASLAISALKNRGRSAVVRPHASVSLAPQARALGALPQRLSSSAAQKADPELQNAINARKALRQAAGPDVLFERFVGIGDRVSGELPPNSRLRAADVYAASTLIMANPVFAPTIFQPTSAVGSTFTFILNTMLQTVLAAAQIYDWAGDILRLTASQLNSQPLFSVTRTLGGVATTWVYTIPAMTNASELTMFNGRMVAAVPRFAAQAVTVGPVADPTNQIVVVGLPVASYAANLRLLVPGDSQVEGLLSKMV